MKVRNLVLAAAVLGAVVPAPASAVVTTFANFSAGTGGANFRWLVSSNNAAGNLSKNATFYTTATATGTKAAARSVNFSFLQPAIAPFVTNVAADFLMSGKVVNTIATVTGTTLTQTNVEGSFSFLSTAPITIGRTTFATGSNLLSGTFSSAEISGGRAGTSAGFSGSTPDATITYTSDFLDFASISRYDFSLSLTAITPTLNASGTNNSFNVAPNKALRSFRAVVGGQFSSDPPPITPPIPEPDTWTLFIVGFGLIGVSSRRRRVRVAA